MHYLSVNRTGTAYSLYVLRAENQDRDTYHAMVATQTKYNILILFINLFSSLPILNSALLQASHEITTTYTLKQQPQLIITVKYHKTEGATF